MKRHALWLSVLLTTQFAVACVQASSASGVVDMVNRLRLRECAGAAGTKRLAPAPPLALDERLHTAAAVHAKDMAKRKVLSHTGGDGSEVAERATRAGYPWKTIGENVASGPLSAQAVVAGWLSSPHHCENIMNGDFTHMAVAYALVPNDTGIYWAQVFGRPQ